MRRQGGSTTVYLPGGQELTATGSTVKATRYYSFGGQVVAVRTGPYGNPRGADPTTWPGDLNRHGFSAASL